jgi:hypothetical protein
MSQATQLVTIMPDYGFGPYAWEKPATDQSSLIGQCIATAVDGFESEDGTTISDSLQADFAAWTEQFERFAEKPGFDWSAFHRLGMELSHRLKHELGSRYRVVYHKPVEDPNYEIEAYVEVLGDA